MKSTPVSALPVPPAHSQEVVRVASEAKGPSDPPNGKKPESSNGSASRSPARFARAKQLTVGVKLLVLAIALVLVALGSGGGWYWFHSLGTGRTDILTAPVKKGKLAIT